VHAAIVPVLVGLSIGAALIAIGDDSAELYLLATISGAIFGDLARRARREQPSGGSDPTDVAIALGFFAIIGAGAVDLGGADRAAGTVTEWLARAAATVVILAGLALRAASVRALGSAYSVRLRTRAEQPLIHSGPYRFVRHPNYAALLIVACGIAVGLRSPLALTVTFLVWLPIVIVRITREERLLIARFGDRYREYCGRTSRLVPGIY
jgi:protein-S-isoprenylcysteine O-methyltransferase Ste14